MAAFVYIMSNKKNGVLYIGVTSDLVRRAWEHRNGVHEGFTKKYKLHRLVYFETADEIMFAIAREKQMKKLYRSEKRALIESMNPKWHDLFEDISNG